MSHSGKDLLNNYRLEEVTTALLIANEGIQVMKCRFNPRYANFWCFRGYMLV